ncbi:hypothetical protein V6N12_052241 [Hibiscus sabdariffa]|uniref:Uncharacterized protein n=1 Tax=Hibiscus sabdariffa TaxID=183260 RepID=A0ABR2GJH5_9ROSI
MEQDWWLNPVQCKPISDHYGMAGAVDNAVMETIDPEIAETCKDLGAVKKLFYAPIGSTGDALSDTGPRKPDATRHPTNNTASLDPTDTSSMKPSM